jgi:excisionase family DNA binding protein
VHNRTIPEVMAVLRVSRSTVYRLRLAGSLASVRVGRQVRIPEDSLRAFLTPQPVGERA